MNDLREQLEVLANRILENEGFELVEVSVKGNKLSPIFQFFVFQESGVTVEDCARLSRKLTDCLDGENLPILNYRLEVSSPGMDRPLKVEKDFLRNLGRDLIIQYSVEDQLKRIEGTLLLVQNGEIVIQTQDKTIHIPLSSIKSAKNKLKW